MKRREFMAVVGGAAAWPLAARAQQQPPPPLIAVLEGASGTYYDAFRAGLRELGYIEGRTIRIEYRYADGAVDRLPALAAELVRLNPTMIVAAPVPAVLAARKVTATIPIVMANSADPVAFGLVQSLSRPGGNVTGLTNFAEDLAAKQLDILRELLPRVVRLGVLVNVTNPLHVPQWQQTETAAAKPALSLVRFDYRVPDDLERAFAEFAREKVQAVLVPPDVSFAAQRARIAELATKARLPSIYFSRISAEAGGLLSYGPNVAENYRRAAVFVDKILKGAKPGDLPVERPTKIELVINLKTAKELGLAVPPTLLARADEVIE
jgi:putative ABC transport system substrate-binding protein